MSPRPSGSGLTRTAPAAGIRYDAIVIGGGLQGCSVAVQLGLRGRRTLVLEKDWVGRHASGVNAGGVRRLGRHLAEIPLSLASMEQWWRIRDLVDDDCGFQESGQVRIAEDDADLRKLSERAARVRELGYDHEELVGPDELYRLVPALAPGASGALVCRRDGFASPYHTSLAFARRAVALGAVLLQQTPVVGLERRGEEWRVATPRQAYAAPVLVNCAGAWGGHVAGWLGEPVPISTKVPMMMVTARMPPFLKPVVGLASRKLSFKQMPNGTVVIGGGYMGRGDTATNRTQLNVAGLKASAATVCSAFPIMANATVTRAWAGLEGLMPDGIPVIGASGTAPQAWHAFGFSAHGFQLGPIVGQLLAEAIVDGKPSLSLDAFSIRRFRQPPVADPAA